MNVITLMSVIEEFITPVSVLYLVIRAGKYLAASSLGHGYTRIRTDISDVGVLGQTGIWGTALS